MVVALLIKAAHQENVDWDIIIFLAFTKNKNPWVDDIFFILHPYFSFNNFTVG